MRWYAGLSRSGAFARVRQRGQRCGQDTLRAFALTRGSGPLRVGITVPGTVGPAVVRNLLRRRIQGALDAIPLAGRPSRWAADLVFLVQPGAASRPYAVLARDVAAALGRLAPGRQTAR